MANTGKKFDKPATFRFSGFEFVLHSQSATLGGGFFLKFQKKRCCLSASDREQNQKKNIGYSSLEYLLYFGDLLLGFLITQR